MARADYQLGHGFDIGPVNIAGYADVALEAPRREAAMLNVNDLSLFVTAHLHRLINPFTEVEVAGVELAGKPSSKRDGGGDIAFERLYNDAYLTDSFTLRIGKMLSPVGEWNVIHASPLVLSDVRPAVTFRNFSEYTTGLSVIYSDPAGFLPDVQIYWQPDGELSRRPRRLEYRTYREVEGLHLSFDGGLLDKLGLSYQRSVDLSGEDESLFGADYHYTAGRFTLEGEATASSLSQRQPPLAPGPNAGPGAGTFHARHSEWGGYAALSYAVDDHWSPYTWYEVFMDRSSRTTAQDLLFGVAYHFQPALVARAEYVQNIGGAPVNRTGPYVSLSVLF